MRFIRMVLVSLPAVQCCTDKSGKLGPVDLEIPLKCVDQVLFLLAVLDVLVPEIEAILSVGVCSGKFRFRKKRAVCQVVLIQRSAGRGV